MTNTYSSKKTKMKRSNYAGMGHCRCSYCCTVPRGRNQKRANKFRWILKFDTNHYSTKSKGFQKIEV